jgi:hypothetical protein
MASAFRTSVRHDPCRDSRPFDFAEGRLSAVQAGAKPRATHPYFSYVAQPHPYFPCHKLSITPRISDPP